MLFFLFGRRNILRVLKRERNFQANRFIERVFVIVLIPHFDCGKLFMAIERAFHYFIAHFSTAFSNQNSQAENNKNGIL